MRKLAYIALPVSFVAAQAWGSGFVLNEQSAATQGTAFAGATVEQAPSVQFSNPAGLAFLSGNQAQAGGNVYFTHAKFENQGSTSLLGQPMTGGNDTSDPTIFAPFLYYSHSLSDVLKLGIGIYAPFGLMTEYSGDSSVRYHALKSDLKTIEINPNIAYKVTPNFAIGAGLIARYSTAELTSAIDLGSIGAANRIPGSVPQGQDGRAKVEGDDWGFGFKLGLEFLPFEGTRVGLGYRSMVKTTLEGDAEFSLTTPGQILSGATGIFRNSDATASIDYPEQVSLSVSQVVTPQLTLLGDVSWTNWSRFKELRVKYANAAQPNTVTSENWDDSWRVSVGAAYALTPSWMLRGGVAYDFSPVPDDNHRTARVPDGDRLWLALGAGYNISDSLSINAAFAHLMFSSEKLVQADSSAGTLRGQYDESRAEILTVDLVYKF